jgi:hypothetical protein
MSAELGLVYGKKRKQFDILLDDVFQRELYLDLPDMPK